MILLIDNYDSFAHNLARYLRLLGQEVQVVRNDRTSPAAIERLAPAAIVMSPGPCTPNEAGVCLAVVEQLHARIPMLGVCLGHQAICQALGGVVVRHAPVHGQAHKVRHNGHALFQNIPSPFPAGRYHSLVAAAGSLPAKLEIIATLNTEEGATETREPDVVMAVAHREFPVAGIQFHPESILTPSGMQLLANFLAWAGIPFDPPPAIQPDGRAAVAVNSAPPHAWQGAARPHPFTVSGADAGDLP